MHGSIVPRQNDTFPGDSDEQPGIGNGQGRVHYRNLVIAITLDAHSGDLSKYDFVQSVTLRNDRGQQVLPLRWIATADGAHHRAGGLLFPRADQTGQAIDAPAKTLELTVRNLGGVAERVLRLTLPVE